MHRLLISLLVFGVLSAHADETWTVGPGKDYATLAAAETAKNTNMTGRGVVTLECYSGANLGRVVVSGGANSDSSNYLNIVAAQGHRHQGIVTTNGVAHILGDLASGAGIYVAEQPYVRITGLALLSVTNAGVAILVASGTSDAPGIVVEGNLMARKMSPAYWSRGIHIQGAPSGSANRMQSVAIRNNIVYAKGAMSEGVYLQSMAVGGPP